jgi:hypothetical protein
MSHAITGVLLLPPYWWVIEVLNKICMEHAYQKKEMMKNLTEKESQFMFRYLAYPEEGGNMLLTTYTTA